MIQNPDFARTTSAGWKSGSFIIHAVFPLTRTVSDEPHSPRFVE
ncbi:MAG: hypothetical protein WBV82_24520 [Myxococcaceae bacterium]